MVRVLAIAAGGAIGAVLRYTLGGWVQGLAGARFPWGTLTVNVTGSFALGLLMGYSLTHVGGESWGRDFLGIGVLGAFTTFSTFSYETMTLLGAGHWRAAFANIVLNVFLAFTAALFGMRLIR